MEVAHLKNDSGQEALLINNQLLCLATVSKLNINVVFSCL